MLYQRSPCCTTISLEDEMGTIIPRKRKSGSTGYHAQVLIKRKGAIVHRESRTFDRKQAAVAWVEKRETELAKPGALQREKRPTLPWLRLWIAILESPSKTLVERRRRCYVRSNATISRTSSVRPLRAPTSLRSPINLYRRSHRRPSPIISRILQQSSRSPGRRGDISLTRTRVRGRQATDLDAGGSRSAT